MPQKNKIEKELRKLIKKWQALLQLHEWKILSETKNLEYDNARVNWNRKYREALITCDPDAEDMERETIHELLHVLFADMLQGIDVFVKSYIKDEGALELIKTQIDIEEHRIIEKLTALLQTISGLERRRDETISVQHKRQGKKMGRKFPKKSSR